MIGDGVIVSPQRFLCVAPVGVGFGEVWFQADRLVIIGDSVIVRPNASFEAPWLE